MRKVLFFVLLLVVFLLALVMDWNLRQESESARSETIPPEIRDDDIIEVTIGYPEGTSPARSRPGAAPARPGPERPVPHQPVPPAVAHDPDGTGGAGTGTNRPSGNGGTRRTPPSTGPERRIYIVEKGDNLSTISKKLFGDETHAARLKEWNRLRNPDLIVPGQELIYYK